MTVSDKKLAVASTTDPNLIAYYNADVVTANDYYPFGSQMPGRKFAQANSSYRYGFNGQENSDEIAAGLTTAMYWEYDSRIGRRWNADPVVKANESPYLCFSGNPILISDVNGDEGTPGTHTVKQGENLSSIAKKYHTTVNAILKIEGNKWLLKNPNNIKFGQNIILPDLAIDDSKGSMSAEELKKVDFTKIAKSSHFKTEGNNFEYGIRQPTQSSNSLNEMDSRFSDFLNGTGMTNLVYGKWNPITNDIKNHYITEGVRSNFYQKMGLIYYYARGNNSATIMFPTTEEFKKSDNFFKALASVGSANYVNGTGKWTPQDANKTPLTNGMQFVGSCSISIYTTSDAKRLIFVVANSTSRWSYKAHGLLSGSENIPRANPYGGYIPGKGMYPAVPQSTILNLYIWTEPLNFNRLYFGY